VTISGYQQDGEMIMRDVAQKAVSFYDHRVVSIATPEQSLGYLEKIMERPGDSLVLKSQKFRLNWMGVRVDDIPGSEGNEISLAEFQSERNSGVQPCWLPSPLGQRLNSNRIIK